MYKYVIGRVAKNLLLQNSDHETLPYVRVTKQKILALHKRECGCSRLRGKSVKKIDGVSVKKSSLFDPGATGRVWKILVTATDF